MNTIVKYLVALGLLWSWLEAAEVVKPPRFAIYMPRLDVYTETPDVHARVHRYFQTTNLIEIPLAEYPIISEEDLVSYDWDTHTLELKNPPWFMLHKPHGRGIPFVVVVEGVPIYVGAFWLRLSSRDTDVPAIRWDFQMKSTSMTIMATTREGKSERRTDPRPNERLKQVLQELGKLRNANYVEIQKPAE